MVEEDGHTQRIGAFSFERPGTEAQPAATEALPPNVYSNRPAARTNGPITILLLDTLNTAREDQIYARQQALKFIAKEGSGERLTAILVLGRDLQVLQDFTTDRRLLRAAVQNYVAGRAPLTTGEAPPLPSPPAGGLARAAFERMLETLERMETDLQIADFERRAAITLAALRSIARATSGLPGRKNLVWVSGGFPLAIFPGQDSSSEGLSSRFHFDFGPGLRRTALLLSDAHISIYPVDARGLVGPGIADVTRTGTETRGRLARGGEVIDDLSRQNSELLSPRATMRQMADDTGGRALINRNDIAAAVAEASADGASYYSLGYYPDNKRWDGKFRVIKVRVNRPGLQVRHRRGYYATDAAEWHKQARRKDDELKTALGGDPLPATLITFRARVPQPEPATTATVNIDFRVDSQTVAFDARENGRHFASFDFHAAVFSEKGKLLSSEGRTLDVLLKPDTYAQIRRTGVPFQMRVALASGGYRLRLGVRDNRTGAVGTLDVPVEVKRP